MIRLGFAEIQFLKMYYIEDEHFARQLQTELHAYENFQRQKENAQKENLNPIDAKLEYTDPTPSIHDLFVKFDKKFFWGTLGMVQVLWSNKMTKCAGMCSFEGGRGLCKISLSAPLLSLRPRKDLVETLLHEMIHAYLFVTHNYKDREDHGPEFHKHMFRINKVAGTNITVYHTFYDEVEYYQRHIWRCNGPCQKKKPYFGFVRRAINRPPGPYDNWWKQHQNECQGIFIKISEPEANSKKSRKTKIVKPRTKNKSITDFFFSNKKGPETNTKDQDNNKPSNIKTLADLKNNKPNFGVKVNAGGATVVVTNTDKGKKSKTKSLIIQNSKTKESTKHENRPYNAENSGSATGLSVNSSDVNKSKNSKEGFKNGLENDKVRETVRSIWANKFSNSKSPDKGLPNESSPEVSNQQGVNQVRHIWASKFSDSKSSQKSFTDEPTSKKVKLVCPLYEEACSQEEIQNHFVEVCLDNQSNPEKDKKELKLQPSGGETTEELKKCPVCSEDIFQSEINEHLENCLSCSFENESENDFNNEIVCDSVPCPCCYRWFQESEMNVHIDECLTLNILKEELLAS